MSIRQGLLALLDEEPSYGYQLKMDFEQRTGGTWPLNIGQVYSTLTRLERDGLVVATGADDDGRQLWSITDEGRTELHTWFATPVRQEDRPRDELAIKLALAATANSGVDVREIIRTQRTDSMRVMQQYTRLKKDENQDLAWSLLLDGMIFQTEAEIRWLDHCESRLARHGASIDKVNRPKTASQTDLANQNQARSNRTKQSQP